MAFPSCSKRGIVPIASGAIVLQRVHGHRHAPEDEDIFSIQLKHWPLQQNMDFHEGREIIKFPLISTCPHSFPYNLWVSVVSSPLIWVLNSILTHFSLLLLQNFTPQLWSILLSQSHSTGTSSSAFK